MEVKDSAMKEGFSKDTIENSLFSFNARLSKSQQNGLFDILASTAAMFAPIPAKVETLTVRFYWSQRVIWKESPKIVTEGNSGIDMQIRNYVSDVMNQKSEVLRV